MVHVSCPYNMDHIMYTLLCKLEQRSLRKSYILQMIFQIFRRYRDNSGVRFISDTFDLKNFQISSKILPVLTFKDGHLKFMPWVNRFNITKAHMGVSNLIISYVTSDRSTACTVQVCSWLERQADASNSSPTFITELKSAYRCPFWIG